MKTYSYKCLACKIQFDIHNINSAMTVYCPICGEEANRDYKREANPVHFHGEGFYRTDNKKDK